MGAPETAGGSRWVALPLVVIEGRVGLAMGSWNEWGKPGSTECH